MKERWKIAAIIKQSRKNEWYPTSKASKNVIRRGRMAALPRKSLPNFQG